MKVKNVIESSNVWKYIDDIENVKSMPNDRDFLLLFDDGSVCKHSCKNYPFAIIVAWKEIE